MYVLMAFIPIFILIYLSAVCFSYFKHFFCKFSEIKMIFIAADKSGYPHNIFLIAP